MKKFLAIMFLAAILLLTVVVPLAAIAEETAVTVTEGTGSPYSWGYLATLAGATAATLLIVQFLKVPLDKVWKIPTRFFVYIIALLILLAASAFTTGLTWPGVPLTALNAFLVALTAYGSYEITFAKQNKTTTT